jgi:hypothetical protein
MLTVSSELNLIKRLAVPDAAEQAFVRAITVAPQAFQDFTQAELDYLDRSQYLDEDAADTQTKAWIYRPFIDWHPNHINFTADVLTALTGCKSQETITLPDAYSDLYDQIEALVAARYPDGSSVYWMLDANNHYVVRSGYEAGAAEVDPAEYESQGIVYESPANADTITIFKNLTRDVNDLIFYHATEDTKVSLTQTVTTVPYILSNIVARLYLIIKFIRSIDDAYGDGDVVDSDQWSDLSTYGVAALSNYS